MDTPSRDALRHRLDAGLGELGAEVRVFRNDAARIEDIEINPLMVQERGAVAVDAVIWEETP